MALLYRDELPRCSVPVGFADEQNLLLLFTQGRRKDEVWIKVWDEVSQDVDVPGDPEDGVYRVAFSFAKFVSSLQRRQDEYQPASLALDGPAVRGAKLEALLKTLGCKRFRYVGVQSSTSLPLAWEWPRFNRCQSRDPAFLTLELNHVYGHAPKFAERGKRHPILRVDVTEKQREACLSELTAALGKSAVLLDNTRTGVPVTSRSNRRRR